MNKERIRKIKQRGKKSLLKIIFGRTAIVIFSLILQILALIILFKKYLYFSFWGNYIIAFFMLIYIINQNKKTSIKMTWMILIFLLPVFGTLFYLYVHIDPMHKKINRKLSMIEKEVKNVLKIDRVKIDNSYFKRLSNYLYNKKDFNTHENNSIKYFDDGRKVFSKMLEELKKAEKFIFLEYFTIERGFMWSEILEVLKQKAKENVEIKVLYDGTCSFAVLPHDYPEKLKTYGIEAKMFCPIKPFLSSYHNNRDHRKIMVIDGKVAFNGGVNISDQYINIGSKYGHFKDSALMVKGSAVDEYSLMFLSMWYIDEDNEKNYSKYLNQYENKNANGMIIPYADSPFDEEYIGENVYMDIINNAKRYVYITTPYFVVDNDILNSLLMARKKGVDIKIVVPYKSDSYLANVTSKTYYPQLLKEGIKVYEYMPGFIHSKLLVSDDKIAIVGTINFDYRSLYHHFECATLVYNSSVVLDVKKDIENAIIASNLYEERRNIFMKIMGFILKVFAPLL